MRWYTHTVGLLLWLSTPISAQAQTNELTLRCNDKRVVGDDERVVTNMGVVVNFTRKTVSGFYCIISNITTIDDAVIYFK
jgi:hypothetical protein